MMAAELLVLAVAAALAIRVLLRPPILIEARAHPAIAATAAAVGVVLLAMVARASAASAPARHVVVGAVAILTTAAFVRGRPHHGRSRGLPPGSLALGTSLDAIHDPGFYRAAVRRWGPVFKMSQVHQPVVCIADMDLAHTFFRTHANDLAQSAWSFNRLVPGGYLEYMQGAQHARYRERFRAAFEAANPAESRGVITAVARAQVEALAEASRHGGVDPEPFLLPAATTSLMLGVLGVLPDHPRHASLVALFADLIRPMELYLPVPPKKRATYAALVREVRGLGAGLRDARGEAPPSVLAALVRRDSRALDDETLVGNLILMVKEGSIMVRGLLRWVLKMRCDHPEWAARLRALPDEGARDAMARRFVLETLRLHESRYVYRTAGADLALGAYRIPKGWLVRLCVGEAHERDDRFPDPQAFNPDRFAGDPLAREDFAPFGSGHHACLGGDLTLEVSQAFLREAACAFDARSVADGPPWRINRHWGIWRPSQAWRVVVTPVRATAPALSAT